MPESSAKPVEKKNVITFDASKNESFNLDKFIHCRKTLTSQGYSVALNSGSISLPMLASSDIFVLPDPCIPLKPSELLLLEKYVEHGGKVLVTSTACVKGRLQSNINSFLQNYGISFNSDCVIRTVLYGKYYHPKEALIADGVVNRSLYSLTEEKYVSCEFGEKLPSMPILYPKGSTLNVENHRLPGSVVVLLTTGTVCYPFHRPVCAFYDKEASGGRVIAVGSTAMFEDGYIEREDNSKFFRAILHLLSDEVVRLNLVDGLAPEVSDYAVIPSIEKLSNLPYSCLQESDEIPADLLRLFNCKLSKFDNSTLPNVLRAYKELGISHESLKMIKPKFEAPLPQLQPSFIPPLFHRLPGPNLEMFDLDEEFALKERRLARLTNKCGNEDLEYYVTECSKILQIHQPIPSGVSNAKRILESVLFQLAEYKKGYRGSNIKSGSVSECSLHCFSISPFSLNI